MSGDRIFIVKGRRDSVCLISASFLPFPCFNFYLFLVSSKCWLFGNAGVDKTYVSWKIFKAVSEHCTCHSEQTPSELNHRLHVCVWACYSALLPTPVLVDQLSCFLHCCTAALLHYCTPPCYMSCYFAWISKCVFKLQIYIALVGW